MASAVSRAASLALCALALVGCHRTTPQEQAAKDAHDEALIHRAEQERPPLQPVRPEPVSFAELARHDVSIPMPPEVGKLKPGDGCTFTVAGIDVLAAVPQVALARFSGRLEALAADSGSPAIEGGLHRKYAGGEHAIELVPATGGAGATLIIRDRYDRIAYSAPGKLSCNAASPSDDAS